jgi:hypothetical protein
MLHSLSKVIPQWVEDCNNDLRQGNLWTIVTLISSVEDHLRNVTGKEPVKSFLSITKQAEEKRVLSRLNQNNSQPTPRQIGPRPPKPFGFCKPCGKEHTGPNEDCWIAHPELMPPYIKKKRDEAATTAAAAAKANVTMAYSDNSQFSVRLSTISTFKQQLHEGRPFCSSTYSNHAYISITSFVLQTILQKAVQNNDYKQRYCYQRSQCTVLRLQVVSPSTVRVTFWRSTYGVRLLSR